MKRCDEPKRKGEKTRNWWNCWRYWENFKPTTEADIFPEKALPPGTLALDMLNNSAAPAAFAEINPEVQALLNTLSRPTCSRSSLIAFYILPDYKNIIPSHTHSEELRQGVARRRPAHRSPCGRKLLAILLETQCFVSSTCCGAERNLHQ